MRRRSARAARGRTTRRPCSCRGTSPSRAAPGRARGSAAQPRSRPSARPPDRRPLLVRVGRRAGVVQPCLEADAGRGERVVDQPGPEQAVLLRRPERRRRSPAAARIGSGRRKYVDRLARGNDGSSISAPASSARPQAPAATTQAPAVISSPSVLTRTEPRPGSMPVTRRSSSTTAPAVDRARRAAPDTRGRRA